MKRGVLAAVLLSALALAGGARADQTFTDRCAAMDGDTLLCEGAAEVRLRGVDAPEMDTWPWGPLSRAALDAALGDGAVACVSSGKRSHDRLVAVCVNTATGADLAEAVIRAGLATAWRKYLYPAGPPAQPHAYDRAEAAARADGLGVWGMWVEQ